MRQVERLIEQRTNELRVEQGMPKVVSDGALDRAAREFAAYMARTDRYGHTADGKEPADRARARGYDYCMLSENIAFQYRSDDFATADLARQYVDGWNGSPGHRRNMLAPAVTDIGVGVARSARTGRYYGVQLFGRPRARSIAFRVVNQAREAVRYRIATEPYALSPGQGRLHTLCAPEDVMFTGLGNAEGRKIRPSDGDLLQVEGSRRLTVRR